METTKNSADRFQLLIKAYERFVPRQFLNLLGKDEIISVKFGDQIEKNMTILFSDIRDFTSLSEESMTTTKGNGIRFYFSKNPSFQTSSITTCIH